MTGTLISLISILFGIIGAYSIAYLLKNYSLGFIGNTISGVFGSILLIKSIGRLGIDPKSIIGNNSLNWVLFIINVITSFLGGVITVIAISKLKKLINNKH